MAQELRLPAPPMALVLCGYLLSRMGDPRGRALCEEAVVAAQTQGLGGILAYCQLGVAEVTLAEEGPRAAAGMYPAALRSAERHGDRETARGCSTMMADCLLLSGSWDDALRLAERLADDLQDSHALYDLLPAQVVVLQVRGRRGEIGPDDAAVTWLLETCRTSALSMSHPVFVVPAALYARSGAMDTAAALIEEWLAASDPPDLGGQIEYVYEAARIAVAADFADLNRRHTHELGAFDDFHGVEGFATDDDARLRFAEENRVETRSFKFQVFSFKLSRRSALNT